MKSSDYLTVAAMIVLITPIVVTVMVITGIPGVTPKPPRNENVTGQGNTAGT